MDRYRTSKLHIREDFCSGENFRVEVARVVLIRHCVCLMLKDKLFYLRVVGHVTIVVDTAGLVPCTAHDPAASSDQKQFESIFRALIVNVALDQNNEPMRRYALSFEIFAHIKVPHVADVHGTFITDETMRGLLTSVIVLKEH